MNKTLIRPGRHLSQPPVHAPNAALLIDFDNVTLGVQKDLTKELRTLLNSDIIKGKVAVQRAYADWRRYPQYIVPLSESSIDLIFAPAFGTNKKNATDIRLAIDAIELVFTRPEIGTFILLSGDSDFSTMVIKLKEYGKYVVGVGIRESASDLLIQNCDEYYSYNDLAGLTKEVDAPSAQRDPWQLAGEAVAQMARNGDVMRSDRLKQVMQQIDPNFDERNAGFNRFSKFVVEAGQKGMLAVSKLENGQYEVAPLVGGVAAPPVARAEEPAREEGPRRGRSRRGGRGRDRERPAEAGREDGPPRHPPREARTDGALTLARAFQLMSQALGELRPPVGHEPLRLRMAALHGKQDALLDAPRFSRLLRQANDAEVADVRKVGDDEYEISPHRTGAMPAAPAQSPAAAPTSAPATSESAPVRVEAASEPAGNTRENGQRFGVRFRRGSRSPLRAGDVPLVGVVEIDIPAGLVPEPAAAAAPALETSVAEKAARPRRAPRKKAAASAATAEAPAPPEAAAPPKRPRPRARKKKVE
ncbi:MAG: NYN domain-containing protein [Gemmatimonadales bacterium]